MNEGFAGDIRRTMLLLLAAGGFVLLIVRMSPNLVLARARFQQREMAA